ncbi:unnamed protein product [Gordionus sp. m RMFG-2023]
MKAVIIGGNGFLGKHVVNLFISKGYETWIFDIYYDKKANIDAKFFKGSICNEQDLNECLKDTDIVINCVSPPEYLNDINIFKQVNIDGTKNILKCCKSMGVTRILLVSSASVVYEGKDICNGNESLPYAQSFLSPYIQTKIEQEKLVLQANDTRNNFLTVAIRPHGIYGPGDKLLVPQTLKAAKENKLKFIVGDGRNVVDFTYVENVANAIFLASEKLKTNEKEISGQAFNITNDEPTLFWDFLTKIIVSKNYPAPKYKLPYSFIYFILNLILPSHP